MRNPYSVRPYEHVLEPVVAYLMVAKEQYKNKKCAGSYNIGPDEIDCRTTGELVTLFCEKWNRANSTAIDWINQYDGGPHEANFLKLDCSRIKKMFGWKPTWNLEIAVEKTVEWAKIFREQKDIIKCMERQIQEYLERRNLGTYK